MSLITAIAAPNLPKPLPADIDASLKPDHLDGPLVRVAFGTGDSREYQGVRSYHQGNNFSFCQQNTIPGVTDKKSGGYAEDLYTKVDGDFNDAVRAASSLSRYARLKGGNELDAASAVLQGNDGSYYVTSLIIPGWTIDEPLVMNDPALPLKNVSVLNPAVKAIVDRDEWIDFSGGQHKVSIDGAGATAPTSVHNVRSTPPSTIAPKLTIFERDYAQSQLHYSLVAAQSGADAMNDNRIPRVFRSDAKLAPYREQLASVATSADNVVALLNALGAGPASVQAATAAAALIRGVDVTRDAVKQLSRQGSRL